MAFNYFSVLQLSLDALKGSVFIFKRAARFEIMAAYGVL